MPNRAPWIAFLLMCFAITGMTGLFASYAVPVPLERALRRVTVLDQVLDAATKPDAAARLQALRPALGGAAAAVLDGPGDLTSRVAEAKAVAISEQGRESASAGYRIRLIVVVVTCLGGLLGSLILGIAARQR